MNLHTLAVLTLSGLLSAGLAVADESTDRTRDAMQHRDADRDRDRDRGVAEPIRRAAPVHRDDDMRSGVGTGTGDIEERRGPGVGSMPGMGTPRGSGTPRGGD